MRLKFVAAVALAAASVMQDALAAAPYTDCIDSHTTNMEWDNCSKDELARQETSLADAWYAASEAMKKLSEKSFKMLLDEQRAWIQFKDSACQFYQNGDFGREGQVLHYGACKSGIIAERVRFLRGLTSELNSH